MTGSSGGNAVDRVDHGSTNRFEAMVVAKLVINWLSFTPVSGAYNIFMQVYWFSGLRWDHTEHYMKRSRSRRCCLLTGEGDCRTQISESEQDYWALKLRKIDVAMVRILGASDGIAACPSKSLFQERQSGWVPG